jgi:outer membrane protein TolC
MRRRSFSLRTLPFPSLLLSLLLFSSPATAQPLPAAQPPVGPPPPAGALPAPGPPPPTPRATPAPDRAPPPKPIDVSDPLLAPVPPAPHILTGWRDVLALLSTRSVDLIVARQEIEKAEGARRQSLAGSLPTITATGTLTGNAPMLPPTPLSAYTQGASPTTLQQSAGLLAEAQASSPASNPYLIAQLTLTQPILAPRAWYDLETKKLGIKAATLSSADKRRVALAAAADAIVEVVTAERVAELNRVGLKGALQRVELASRHSRLGSGTRLDVVRAEQDATVTRATLVAGDEDLLKKREALGLLLGSSEGYGVPPTISLNEVQQAVGDNCAAGTADQRADVQAAVTQVAVAERGITDAKLAFAPTASLSLSTGAATTTVMPNGEQTAWSIGAVLTVPLWEGGARYGAMRIARAQAEEQKAQVEGTRRTAELDATQAIRSVIVAEKARELSSQNVVFATEVARLSQVAFEAGTGTSFDLVDSGRRQREAELDLAVKEFEVIKAKLASLLATANCSY